LGAKLDQSAECKVVAKMREFVANAIAKPHVEESSVAGFQLYDDGWRLE
jgi:hypothetical protein